MAAAQQIKYMCLSISKADVTNAVKTFDLSKKYIKDIVRVLLLNILYRRYRLPSTQFVKKKFETIEYMVFKRKATHPIIRKYHSWIHGLMDAIEKNYLKEVHLFLKDDAVVLEHYKLCIQYKTTHDLSRKNKTSDYLKDKTMYLLKVIYELGELDPIPDNVEPYIEFTYWDETPTEYEPPGFVSSANKEVLNLSDSEDFNLLSSVNTGFHKLSCHRLKRLKPGTLESSTCLNEVIEPELTEDATNTLNVLVGKETVGEIILEQSPKCKKKRTSLDNSNITLSAVSELSEISEPFSPLSEDCLCKLSSLLPNIKKLKCKQCNKVYHAPCHGYLESKDVDFMKEKFNCFQCDRNTAGFPDELDEDQYKTFARVRLMIVMLKNNIQIPTFFNTLPTKERDDLFNMLYNNKVCYQIDGKWNYSRKINNLVKFFITMET